jgi:two-component system, NarL family, invasion response regulator UvrY
MIKIMLVDDHRLVRAGLKRVLQEVGDVEVIAEASSGEEALEITRTKVPDVVLMDINMPGIGGLEATRRLVQRMPSLKVVVVSMHLEEPYPSRMLAAGAAGYISKDSAADEVVAAIRRVYSGGHYVAADVAGNLAASLVKGTSGGSPFDQLSQRETQVMLMVTKGYSTQEISDRLHLSPKTVSTYRYRLFEKLNVNNDVELTRMAMRYGLLEDKAAEPSTGT